MVSDDLLINQLFRQRVSSPTTSSPTYEVVSPTSNVSSSTLICQYANVQNTETLSLTNLPVNYRLSACVKEV